MTAHQSASLLQAIEDMLDRKLDEKLEQKLEQKLDEKLAYLHASVADLQNDMKTVKRTLISHDKQLLALTQDSQTIRYTLGSHGLMLGNMHADMRASKDSQRDQAKDVHRLSVLFEDLDSRFAAVAEA